MEELAAGGRILGPPSDEIPVMVSLGCYLPRTALTTRARDAERRLLLVALLDHACEVGDS